MNSCAAAAAAASNNFALKTLASCVSVVFLDKQTTLYSYKHLLKLLFLLVWNNLENKTAIASCAVIYKSGLSSLEIKTAALFLHVLFLSSQAWESIV